MALLNEKVQHIKFGFGVVTEEKDNRIWVKFQKDEVGTKLFLYPEVFEKFLKADNTAVENGAQEELRIRQQQVVLEREERERNTSELREKIKDSVPVKKKTTRKKSSN